MYALTRSGIVNSCQTQKKISLNVVRVVLGTLGVEQRDNIVAIIVDFLLP